MSDYSAVAPPPTQNQSSAFAAALQRARQIAAKINPTSASNPDIKLKRSLEDGSEPEAKKLAPDPLLGLRGQAGLGDPSGGLRGPPQASSPPHGIGAGLGGNCVEDIRVPDKMVGLIIGRGGEQITRLQSETGCKIQMAPESGGLPDRVCTLTGSREAVNRAKERVLSIVNDRCRAEGLGESNMGGSSNSSGSGSIGGGGSSSVGGGGGGSGQMMSGHPGSVEIMIPGPKVGLIIGKGGETIKQLQEKSGAKMVVIQDGPSQEQEKPLRITGDPQKVEYAKNLVYELIAEKEMQMFQRGGPRGGSERSNSFSNDNGFNHGGAGAGGGGSGGGASPDGVEVLVPRAAVGVVIGKGGDMIKKIQSETGARVQFQQGREDGPGDRKCLLSGKPQAVEQARQKIQELIDSRRDDRNPMGGGRGGGAPGGAGGNGGGPRGNGFGAGRPNEYGGWDRRNSGGSMENKIETTYKVPSTKCGIIIGKGGETIKQINQQTGAHCELDRNNQNFDNNEKTFIIRGTPEQVEHAKRIFTEKLGGGGGGMGGAPYGGGGGQGAIGYNPSWNPNSGYQTWPNQGQPNDGSNPAQQVQMNPQTGQPDYSAQWVEYYRSLGMHREAEIIEQQSKQVKTEHPQQQQQQQQQPAPPGSAGGVAGQQPQAAQQQPQAQQVAAQNGAQADYSAQWAEYYRSMGKIQEAEAIEAQMKSGKMGTPGNQMAQSQMQQPQQQQQQQQQQQKIQGQPGNPTAPATPNAFPQAYGTYPGMNPGGGPGGYYPTGGANAGGNNSAQQQQQQPGQQNPNFGGGMGYQNYPYSQQNSDN